MVSSLIINDMAKKNKGFPGERGTGKGED